MSGLSDKEIYHLTVAINKALNPMEAPLKIKHARSAIIITHRTRASKSFWIICTRQPLMENRFTAWKFCHLLHKVLREGHESILKQSLTHRKMVTEMGKLWGHLQDGVGHCIKSYSKLLVTKINFHEKNRIFPGTLIIADFADIERYAQGDINVHFQMCVEVFDYLDDILDVQATVFTSMKSYRMSSMTPQGQCRLAPLITLIQDSNPLYDVCVRLMFRLHDELPNDILAGHRERFRDLFGKLKTFYENVRPLQYFADLIQVPHLPEMAPNFSSRVDFGSYVPPVVHVPEEPEPEPIVNDLVDTSFTQQEQQQHAIEPNLEVMQLEQSIRERDQRIFELQSDLIATRESINMLKHQYKEKLTEMREENVLLNNELATKQEQCANMRLQRDELELKLTNTTPTLLQKASEGEEKAKQSEEKFNKLKSLYTSIRDEHIQLLRKHGESTKLLNREQSSKQELQQRCEDAERHSNELQEKCALVQAQTEQMKALEQQRNELEEECTIMRSNYETLELSKNADQLELSKHLQQLANTTQALTASKEKVQVLEQQLASTQSNLEDSIIEQTAKVVALQEELKQKSIEISNHKQQKQELQNELEAVRLELQQVNAEKVSTTAELQTELTNKVQALEERESRISSLDKQLADLQMNLQNLSTESETNLTKLQATLATTSSELNVRTGILAEQNEQLEQVKLKLTASEEALSAEKQKLEQETKTNQALQQQLTEATRSNSILSTILDQTKTAANDALATHEKQIKDYELRLQTLLGGILQQAANFYAEKANDNDNNNQTAAFRQTVNIAKELGKQLEQLQNNYLNYQNKPLEEMERLGVNVMALAHQLCMLYEQGNYIAHTSADIEKSEILVEKLRLLCALLLKLHKLLPQPQQSQEVSACCQQLGKVNDEICILLGSLVKSMNTQTDLGDMVQNELNEMDKTIEEAVARFVELLSATREQDNGIQLEVNEKILDACTSLMECIKQLIKKSKILQDEIVSAGRGKSSAKEFYKRNSHWTEGLISASKSVAKGANLLVDAANKAVTSPDSNEHFEIIVAAQEIAACTAQLVIASKVKAPTNSGKLVELTQASRNVSKATGAVVATVKSCSQHLEKAQEIDITKLTASQLKAMEMEIHVKVLELEQALEMERRKLSSFRRQNYQNNDDS